jgi:hypothetical protein
VDAERRSRGARRGGIDVAHAQNVSRAERRAMSVTVRRMIRCFVTRAKRLGMEATFPGTIGRDLVPQDVTTRRDPTVT